MTIWTPNKVEELKRLWSAREMSAALIGQELGITKNAVLGKINRLGLSDRRGLPYPGMVRPRSRRQKLSRVILGEIFMPIVLDATQKAPLNIPFLELGKLHCREIVGRGEDGLTIHCGHEEIGRSFCAFHHSINFTSQRMVLRTAA